MMHIAVQGAEEVFGYCLEGERHVCGMKQGYVWVVGIGPSEVLARCALLDHILGHRIDDEQRRLLAERGGAPNGA